MVQPKKHIKGKHQKTDWGHGVKQVQRLKKSPVHPGGKPPAVEIVLDEATSRGTYTNAAKVAHTETEFLLDFLFLQPGAPKTKVHTRLITSPKHAKRFAAALAQNLKNFEERFGPVR